MFDATAEPIIALNHIDMNFTKPSGGPLPVLSGIDVTVHDGEILGLLGRSGSGKSTLLRIAGGLIKPSAGHVVYRGKPLSGPAEGIAVVFQSFALYPWLTVLENVELGLDAARLPADETRRRAVSAIDLIGLDGFQSAYPRELSGGMRQRVGFARALVSDPILLLMDEPFSALDVLTAESLRTDFLDLWVGRQLPTRAVLMVTHNIEEAVLMCDRVLVLGANPGRIAAEIAVPLPQPRNRLDAAFHSIVDEIYSILTSRMTEAMGSSTQNLLGQGWQLPEVAATPLGGFVEALAAPPYEGKCELARIGKALALPSNRLFPIAAALHLLEFAELEGGMIKLTAAGRVLAQSDTDDRKRLFREHLVRFVPLVAHIRQILDERDTHAAPRERFEYELEDHLPPPETEKTMRTAIDWARYAELFTYDDRTRSFSLNHIAA